MIKVRLVDKAKGTFEKSYYSVADREELLGFPRGYVGRIGEHFLRQVIYIYNLANNLPSTHVASAAYL